MHYRLYFPTPDEKGRTMLGSSSPEGVRAEAREREYELVYQGEIGLTYQHGEPVPVLDTAAYMNAVLEAIWKRHNVGDQGDGNRPRAREIRSMCVGDIVGTDAGTYLVASFGFEEVREPINLLGGLR